MPNITHARDLLPIRSPYQLFLFVPCSCYKCLSWSTISTWWEPLHYQSYAITISCRLLLTPFWHSVSLYRWGWRTISRAWRSWMLCSSIILTMRLTGGIFTSPRVSDSSPPVVGCLLKQGARSHPPIIKRQAAYLLPRMTRRQGGIVSSSSGAPVKFQCRHHSISTSPLYDKVTYFIHLGLKFLYF